MVADVKVIGLRGEASFDDMVKHFTSLGGDVVIMDPMYVCGRIISSPLSDMQRDHSSTAPTVPRRF